MTWLCCTNILKSLGKNTFHDIFDIFINVQSKLATILGWNKLRNGSKMRWHAYHLVPKDLTATVDFNFLNFCPWLLMTYFHRKCQKMSKFSSSLKWKANAIVCAKTNDLFFALAKICNAFNDLPFARKDLAK